MYIKKPHFPHKKHNTAITKRHLRMSPPGLAGSGLLEDGTTVTLLRQPPDTRAHPRPGRDFRGLPGGRRTRQSSPRSPSVSPNLLEQKVVFFFLFQRLSEIKNKSRRAGGQGSCREAAGSWFRRGWSLSRRGVFWTSGGCGRSSQRLQAAVGAGQGKESRASPPRAARRGADAETGWVHTGG